MIQSAADRKGRPAPARRAGAAWALVLAVCLGACTDDGAAGGADAGTAPGAGPTSDAGAPDGRTTGTAAGAAPTVSAGFDQEAEVSRGLMVSVVELAPVQHEAAGPGELGGAAVDVVLEVANGTASPLGLEAVTVTLAAGPDGAPAAEASSASRPFGGTLPPAGAARSTYRFLVAPEDRAEAALSVHLGTGPRWIVFTGSLPG